MARKLDIKLGVADADAAQAFNQPVVGEIGGVKIAIGPRGSNLSLGGFGPGVDLDGGYFQLDLIDEATTAASYVESAVAFRRAAPGPHYLHNPNEPLAASGTVEEVAFFYSFVPYDHTRQQVFSTAGSANMVETLNRVVMRVQYVDAQGAFITGGIYNTNRDMLDVGLNPRRVTACFSIRVLDETTLEVRIYSHIEGEPGWTLDFQNTVPRNLIKADNDPALPGWALGGRIDAQGAVDRAMNADVYGFALMAGPAGSVPDFGSAAVRDTFFDVASGTMHGRDLDVALQPYASTVKFAKHGQNYDVTSGGSLSAATVFNLPPNA